MVFYTYLWLRDDGTPYYVGKGCKLRATSFRLNRRHFGRPLDDANIIIQEFECEADALAAEKILIEFYGRKDSGTGCLRNLTDGGEGVRNMRHSEESLRKMREAARRPRVRTRRKRSPRNLEKAPMSERELQLRRERMKGNKYFSGRKHSAETKAKMSAWHKQYRIPLTQQTAVL